MAGSGRERIQGFRQQQGAGGGYTGSFQRRPTTAEEEALDRLLTAQEKAKLDQYANNNPERFVELQKSAAIRIQAEIAAQHAQATYAGKRYSQPDQAQQEAAVDAFIADKLGIITLTPIEGETRAEEAVAEGPSPIEPIQIQIKNLPAAPALQPPEPIARPVAVALPQVQGFLERLPTPGSVQYLVLVLLFFLLAIVPMLYWNGKGYTRLQLLWRTLTGGAELPHSPYRNAVEQRKARLEATLKTDKQIADLVAADASQAFWGVDLGWQAGVLGALGSGGVGGIGRGGVGAGEYQGYPAPVQGMAGSMPDIGSPGGGWLYDDHGLLVVEQPAGVQNGRKRRRGGQP